MTPEEARRARSVTFFLVPTAFTKRRRPIDLSESDLMMRMSGAVIVRALLGIVALSKGLREHARALVELDDSELRELLG
jgi:hypothetical protein